MSKIKILGKLNPKQYSEMLDHLTRKKIKKPFIDAEDIVVNKKPEIEETEMFNRFNRDNPRQDMSVGGFITKLYRGVKGLQVGRIEKELINKYRSQGMDLLEAINKANPEAAQIVKNRKLKVIQNKLNETNMRTDDYVELIDEEIKLNDPELFRDIKKFEKNNRSDLADKMRALRHPDWAEANFGENYQDVLQQRQNRAIKQMMDDINPNIKERTVVDDIDDMNQANIDEFFGRKKNADGGRIGFDLGGLAKTLHPKQVAYYKDYSLQSGGRSISNRTGKGGSVISLDTLKKEKEIMEFLDKKIEAGETKFNSSVQKFAKDNKFSNQMFQRVLKRHYPQTFVYKGMKYKNLPQATIDKIIKLSKEDKNIKQIVTELADELPDVREVSKKGKPRGAQAQIQRVRSLQKLLKDLGEKPIPVGRSTPLSLDEIVRRDKEIIDYFKKNPNAQESADSLAKKIPVTADYIKQSINERNLVPGIKLVQRDLDIFPEVKALDKIIKENKKLITSDEKVTSKINRIVEKLSEATGKSIPELQSAFFARMRRLGSLYSAPETGLKPRVKVYEQIKPPLDYDANFKKHFIQLASRASKGGLTNTQMAILLGLPENEIRLIGDTATMMKGFPKEFNMQGDHTDIKSMMKNFDDYKNNFTRIEYIKGNLNAYKGIFDKKIKNLSVEAKIANPDRQREILKAQAALRKKFMDETGYRIGEFGIDKGRVFINPKTLRLPDLLNPMNQTLQQAMKNLQTTQVPPDYIVKTGSKPGTKGRILFTPKEVYNKFDNALINAKTVEERLKLFKFANENPEVAKQSKYLQVLSKAPKVGKIAKQIIKGTAVVGGVLGMGALANAAEVKQMPQSSSEELSKDEEGFTTGEKLAGAGTAAGAYKFRKPIIKGAKAVGRGALKLLAPLTVPLEAGFVLSDLKSGSTVPEAIADVALMGGIFRERDKRKFIEDKYGTETLNRYVAAKTPGITDVMDMPTALPALSQELQAIDAEADAYLQTLRGQRAEEFKIKSALPKPQIDAFQAAGGGIAKLAGDRSGAMLESMNPDKDGLLSLMKRGIKT